MSFYFHESFALLVSLSDRHLKRIERLSEGISPLTLLLSSNEISRVENLQYFAHLQQAITAVVWNSYDKIVFQLIISVKKTLHDSLTIIIIPRAQMGYESIAHEAEGRMGYWFRAHEGERNNIIVLVKSN